MAEPSTPSDRRSHTLVYDGECRLCVATKARLEQAGAGGAGFEVRFLPYQCDEARQALGSRYRPGRPEMAYLIGPSGEIREGLDAFLPLAPGLPGGRAAVQFLRVPYATVVARWLYRLIARSRYRLFGSLGRIRERE